MIPCYFYMSLHFFYAFRIIWKGTLFYDKQYYVQHTISQVQYPNNTLFQVVILNGQFHQSGLTNQSLNYS